MGNKESDAEAHGTHDYGEERLARPLSTKGFEKVGTYAIAYGKEKHHEENHLQGAVHWYVELSDKNANEEHGRDAAERERSNADFSNHKPEPES